jgi:hypothetical protein
VETIIHADEARTTGAKNAVALEMGNTYWKFGACCPVCSLIVGCSKQLGRDTDRTECGLQIPTELHNIMKFLDLGPILAYEER